jgi:hypothetical protein
MIEYLITLGAGCDVNLEGIPLIHLSLSFGGK